MVRMKDSRIEWIGQIPETWNLKRIQFCLDEINEKNSPVKTEQVLSLVKDKGVMLYEEKGNQGNKAKEDVSQYKVAYPNTLIVNSMNILIGSVGISDYMGCVSPVYYVFKDTEESDLRYINYIFNTREFQKELRKYANGILEIRLRVSASDIFKRKIPLPDKTTQRKIADYLDKKCSEIDALHSDIEKQIETLEEYKKSVVTEAVTKGLNPDVEMKDSGIEWIGMTPKEWDITKIKYLCNMQSGDNITAQDINPDSDELNCYKVYGANGFRGYYKKYTHNGKYCLVGRQGALAGNVHIANGEFWATDHAVVVYVNKNISQEYMFYLLTSMNLNQYAFDTAAQPGLAVSKIMNFSMVSPNKDEQLEIVQYLDSKCTEIDGVIEDKKKQLETLEEYKKSLIYEYVTGKKEVPDNE